MTGEISSYDIKGIKDNKLLFFRPEDIECIFQDMNDDIEPERKKGKWNFIGDQMFECTECGTCYTQGQFHQMRVRITDSEFPKFCPNCGAKMEAEA